MTRRVSGLDQVREHSIENECASPNGTHLWVCLKVLSNEGVSIVPQYPPLSHVRLVLVRESVVGEGAAAAAMRQGEEGASATSSRFDSRERDLTCRGGGREKEGAYMSSSAVQSSSNGTFITAAILLARRIGLCARRSRILAPVILIRAHALAKSAAGQSESPGSPRGAPLEGSQTGLGGLARGSRRARPLNALALVRHDVGCPTRKTPSSVPVRPADSGSQEDWLGYSANLPPIHSMSDVSF